MSLAPGIGGGTQTKSPTTAFTSKLSVINSSPQSDQEDFEAYTYPSPGPSAPPTPAPPAAPAFGSSRGGVRPSRNRRPATATLGSSGTSPMAMGMTNAGSSSGVGQGGMSRASISGRGMGRISGIGGSLGKTRPGWEGDEVVGVLRSSGMEGEFSVLRVVVASCSATHPILLHLPSHQNRDSPQFMVVCRVCIGRERGGDQVRHGRERNLLFPSDPVSDLGEEQGGACFERTLHGTRLGRHE
jgi:hypothetical protein